jgi:hypothetical protein
MMFFQWSIHVNKRIAKKILTCRSTLHRVTSKVNQAKCVLVSEGQGEYLQTTMGYLFILRNPVRHPAQGIGGQCGNIHHT